MLTITNHQSTQPDSPAIDDDEQPLDLNWQRLRNAIRKRLYDHFRVADRNWSDFDDAIQDACGFAHTLILRGIAPGLAVFRSVGRVKRGQKFACSPSDRQKWETFDPTRSLNGAGQATRRAAAGLPLQGRTTLQ